jgi:hypothetical protein
MVEFSFDDSELAETIDKLTNMSFAGFLKDAGKEIENRITARMSKGLDADDAPFKALSPAYARVKKAMGYGGKPILTATGELGRSLLTEILADDEAYISVFGMHRPIAALPTISWKSSSRRQTIRRDSSNSLQSQMSSMTAIASKQESLGRQFLGINDNDIQWTMNRFAQCFDSIFLR